jgi:hypothetical protein
VRERNGEPAIEKSWMIALSPANATPLQRDHGAHLAVHKPDGAATVWQHSHRPMHPALPESHANGKIESAVHS